MKRTKTLRQLRDEASTKALMQSSGLDEETCHNLLFPDNEETTVRLIKQHLRTPEQRDWLNAHDISIEDMLNGRVVHDCDMMPVVVEDIFMAWNKKLGQPLFGQQYFDTLKGKK